MHLETKVSFVFLGEKLPIYAKASMELAVRHSGMEVQLLGNERLRRQFSNKKVNFVAVEDFYDPHSFDDAAKRIFLSASFRGGFWLKTLERFFVLEQYMSSAKLDCFFHAELDQLLFRTDLLVEKIKMSGKTGIFLPFHNSNQAVASVLFCNKHAALSSLLEFSRENRTILNEMVLIADWSKQFPGEVIPLPTLTSKINQSSNSPDEPSKISWNDIDGVVDAAQLGQWVGGTDPRNLQIGDLPTTKFSEPDASELLTQRQLSGLRFQFNSSDSTAVLTSTDTPLETRIYNLHIHSKIHRWILRPKTSVHELFRLANLVDPVRIPGTRSAQIKNYISVVLIPLLCNPKELFRRIIAHVNRKFRRRPSSRPFISGDTFRAMSDFVWEYGSDEVFSDRIKPGDIIFCESTEIEGLELQILAKIDCSVTILLGNSDKNHSQETAALFNTGKIKSIFAQNLLEQVQGVEILPIGLENARFCKNGSIRDFKVSKWRSPERLPRIMWTFNILTNKSERLVAANSLLNNFLADNLGTLTPRQHQEALNRYCFVAAPPGNGLDTHRAWEAMYLGCIPIVLRSHMTEYYEQIGLPIWVIDSYSDLVRFGEAELLEKFKVLSKRFKSEALTSMYWERQIRDCAKL
jgi:hypothetical protein